MCQHDVTLHCRKKSADSVIQRPINTRCRSRNLGAFFRIIFQNEFLVKAAHTLLIYKAGESVFSFLCSKKHSLQNQLANTDQHTIALIVSLKADRIPSNQLRIYQCDAGEEEHFLFQLCFMCLLDTGMTEQDHDRGDLDPAGHPRGGKARPGSRLPRRAPPPSLRAGSQALRGPTMRTVRIMGKPPLCVASLFSCGAGCQRFWEICDPPGSAPSGTKSPRRTPVFSPQREEKSSGNLRGIMKKTVDKPSDPCYYNQAPWGYSLAGSTTH